jgi:hypothetical protein
MRPSPLLLAVALPLLGCATNDGFRTHLAQGCHSEPECAQLAAQADARAGSCPSTANPNVAIRLRLRLDLGSSAPPCDEVEEDRRIAHGYLERFTQERERQAAWAAQQAASAAQQKAIRRQEQQARQVAEQERRQAAAEAEQRRRAEEDAQDQAERAAREKAAHAAADSDSQSTPVVPATPAPRDTGGHVCCCDGTLSPTCTTVHRGCCSHHGGVCACD